MDNTLPSNLDADLPRFGHTAVVVNGTMVIHGGFNGVLMNDTLIYSPGKCEVFKDKTDCLNAKAGVKCAWNTKKSVSTKAELPQLNHTQFFCLINFTNKKVENRKN